MSETVELPTSWQSALSAEFEMPYFKELQRHIVAERSRFQVFPDSCNVFRAFELTPLEQLKVLIVGQDPYHDTGQAHGLSFSVRPGIKLPPSLRNIFKELQYDLSIPPARHGCLESWARQGVMLLNRVLTVRAHEANSHRGKGWEEFTAKVISIINQRPHVVFVLWGKPAQELGSLIDERHLILQGAHPSPLSAYRGFFGSRPFSRINQFLQETGQTAINWQLESHIAGTDQ